MRAAGLAVMAAKEEADEAAEDLATGEGTVEAAEAAWAAFATAQLEGEAAMNELAEAERETEAARAALARRHRNVHKRRHRGRPGESRVQARNGWERMRFRQAAEGGGGGPSGSEPLKENDDGRENLEEEDGVKE